MFIINNRPGPNHLNNLITCFKDADEIIIASPFISADLSFFPFDKFKLLKKITLITRLKEYTKDQYEKVDFFTCLYKFGEDNDVEIEIMIDNVLHGKVYIGCYKDKLKEAIITSANFNKYGLEYNNEWGVSIKDEAIINQLLKGLKENVILKPLTQTDLTVLRKELDKLPKKIERKETDLNLSKFLTKKENPLGLPTKTIYWLKPIGVTENIIPWGESFNSIKSNLHFAKRPTGVKLGHIIITYAVGHRNFLSVYRVISEFQPSGIKRWPYVVIGENLTPYYGDNWHRQNLTITNQKEEVLSKGLFNITPSGKNSYGSLMRSADKLQITPQYAMFIINKIEIINQKIAEQE